jgi:hypothetical protein
MQLISHRSSLCRRRTSHDLEDRLCRRSRRILRHGNRIRANNHSRGARHAGVTRNHPAGNVAGGTGTDPAASPPRKRSPVPSEQYTGRDLVARGTGDGNDAALPAGHRVSAVHPGKNQPAAVQHGPARHEHAADPAWSLHSEVSLCVARRSGRPPRHSSVIRTPSRLSSAGDCVPLVCKVYPVVSTEFVRPSVSWWNPWTSISSYTIALPSNRLWHG